MYPARSRPTDICVLAFSHPCSLFALRLSRPQLQFDAFLRQMRAAYNGPIVWVTDGLERSRYAVRALQRINEVSSPPSQG